MFGLNGAMGSPDNSVLLKCEFTALNVPRFFDVLCSI